jgi:hypothetical protein
MNASDSRSCDRSPPAMNRSWRHEQLAVAFGMPRTKLGRRLLAIRRKIVASGVPLLDWDGLDRELTERRGELPLRGAGT